MDRVLPWKRLCKIIEPHYQSYNLGRTKKPLLLMLKLYCLQQCYNLSDPGIEDAVYDCLSFQRFLGIGEPGDCVPDETTILNFRHLLEEHKQTKANCRRSSIRAKVEFPFQIIKQLWEHRKVRYKRLYKNACQLYLLFELANVFQVRRQLLQMT